MSLIPKIYRVKTMLVLWLAGFFLAGLLTLGTYPPVNYNLGDETGLFFMSIDYVNGDLGESPVNPKGYFGLQGTFLQAVAETIPAARAFSLLAATITLYLTYLLGRQLGGSGTGLLASVLLGTSYAFFWHARIIRHEMLSAAVIMAAMLFLVHAYNARRNALALGAGLAVALSVTVHPNNLQYVVAFVPAYMVLFRRRAISSAALYLAAGLAAGLALWYVTTYVPSQPAVGSSATSASAARDIAQVVPFPVLEKGFLAVTVEAFRSLPSGYLQYVRQFDDFFPNTVMMAAVAGSWAFVWAIGMLGRHRLAILGLLGFPLCVSFVNYYVAPKYGFWHMVELFPFYAIAAALALAGLAEFPGRRAGSIIAAGAALVLVTMGIVDTAQGYLRFRHYNYPRLLAKVSSGVDGRVLAMDLYAPAFPRQQFVGPWFQLDRPYSTCPLISAKLEELDVQYIVADDLLLRFSRLACGEQYERNFRQYLDRHCRVIKVIDERYPNYWARGDMVERIVIVKTPD